MPPKYSPIDRKRSVIEWGKDHFTPLIPGETAWPASGPRMGLNNGWRVQFWRMPSIFRIFANRFWRRWPKMTEPEFNQFLHSYWRNGENKNLGVIDPARVKNIKHRELIELIQDEKELMSSMRGHRGRARSPMRGGLEKMKAQLNGAALKPYEFANMRIPYQLAYDDQVIWAQAYCQMISQQNCFQYAKLPVHRRNKEPPWSKAEYAKEGMLKFIHNRWVRFAIASPWMTQYGFDFGVGAGFTRNTARLEYLLENCYAATEGELDEILMSPHFEAAFDDACKWMKKKKKNWRPLPANGAYMKSTDGAVYNSPLDMWAYFGQPYFKHDRMAL